MRYLARVGEKEFQIEVAPRGGGRFSVSLDGKTREIERRGDGAVLWLSIDGQIREAAVAREGGVAAGGNGRVIMTPAPETLSAPLDKSKTFTVSLAFAAWNRLLQCPNTITATQTTTGTSAQFTHSVTQNTTYYYRVHAQQCGGTTGPLSAPVSIAVQDRKSVV